MKKTYFIVILFFLVTAIILNKTVRKKEITDNKKRVEHYQKNRQFRKLERLYLEMLENDSLNIDLHYKFIQNHFDIPHSENLNGYNKIRDDLKIAESYRLKSLSKHLKTKDIGFYGVGLCHSIKERYEMALIAFEQVGDKKLKYLNNSIGRVVFNQQDLEKAEAHFKKEIELEGNLQGAYLNLARIYRENADNEGMDELLEDKEARKYVPVEMQRMHYFHNLRFFRYFMSVFGITYSNMSYVGLVAAFLVFLVYLIYLRKIDIYEPEKWKYIVFTFLMGALCSELTYLFADTLVYTTGFYLNGSVVNDFFYCFIGIGMIEELVKIIPLLIMIKMTREVNEPVDYIVYAAISALGFAFAENIMYFTNYGIGIVVGRALTAVVFHMFLSSLIAYGLVLSKYHGDGKPIPIFIKYFTISALIHGTYDFWLINQNVSQFSILSIILFVFCLFLFNTMIKNSLSNSVFFTEDIILNKKKLQQFLVYSISGIIMFQYLVVTFDIGPKAGTKNLINSLISGGYLLAFVSSNLGNIKIRKGDWEPFSVKIPFRTKLTGYELNVPIGKQIKLRPFTRNNVLYEYFPNSGTIVQRFEFANERDWYLVKLDKEIYNTAYHFNLILIRPKERNKTFMFKKREYGGVFVIRKAGFIESTSKQRQDVHFVGWGIVEE